MSFADEQRNIGEGLSCRVKPFSSLSDLVTGTVNASLLRRFSRHVIDIFVGEEKEGFGSGANMSDEEGRSGGRSGGGRGISRLTAGKHGNGERARRNGGKGG